MDVNRASLRLAAWMLLALAGPVLGASSASQTPANNQPASPGHTLAATPSSGPVNAGKDLTGPAIVAAPGQAIGHVVIIVQENRTPDNLFHNFPGADIADSGLNSTRHTITLQPGDLANTYDLSHRHKSWVAMYADGKMDGANHIPCSPNAGTTCPPNPQYAYVDPAQVAPYFELGQQYTFGDRMFETNQGPSFPAHQFIISGTSAPSVGGPYGDYFAAENPSPAGKGTGCLFAAANQTVYLIDPNGVEDVQIFPCFEHPTLMDLLNNAGVSWRYYAPEANSIWTAPNAIEHLTEGPDWANVIIPESNVLTDIAAGNLPQVSWVIPDGLESDHAGVNDGTGPSWVASIVNAIGSSQYWRDTAIIIVWDDWGGWYDHVAPSIYNSYEYGFRVPLIIVSPFAKQGYVSHVTHDFGSILHFVEEVFSLPSLGYADARADDFSDCFDFTQPARPFVSIASKYDGAFFIQRNKTHPPTDPDDD